MIDNYIQLNKDSVLRLGIKDSEGNDTGNMLVFDLEDTELLLRYQNMIEQDKKNRVWLNNQFVIISKKEDHRGKKLLSSNEEAEIKAVDEFFKREKEVFDMFLGEGGVDKLLNGRKLGWTSFREISKIITEQIGPYFDKTMDNIKEKVKDMYKEVLDENEVL